MTQWIGLAKAAHQLRISRRELQKLIQNGTLQTFEGCVDFEELKRLFPGLVYEEESFIERISFLQETAFSRRVRETVMPDLQDLDAKLRKRTADLSVERARADKYCAILRELCDRMALMQCDADRETRRSIAELNRWLRERLEK
jgi:hypothetical protein